MQNSCYFTMQEQLSQVLNILQKYNIENYPNVIIMLCKKLSILYMDDLKSVLGSNLNDDEIFKKLKEFDSGEYELALEIFADFYYAVIDDEDKIASNNLLLEKYSKEWLKRSYGDMQLIASMIDEFKEYLKG
ncbi:hypothetical protein [Campylobacter sp.]